MPRLTRLRYVSVGHPRARMNDLTLDFRDREGRATDSTLWLRNGGGKSSILNLFFSLLRPRKTEFLGGKADSKKRRLEDYILTEDRALVVAEWQLDGRPGELELSPEHLLTGVFHERRSATDKLERLFFCTRISPDHPESTIEALPIFTGGEGARTRRTLAGFRQAWRELRGRAPQLQAWETELQNEWQKNLESAGLDPDLFAYQVRMNKREGGADELFRFTDPEEFVDFLLELAVDPTLADKVGRNIATFRRELVNRKQELLPEAEFAEGTRDRLRALAGIREERLTLCATLGATRARLVRVDEWLIRRREEQSQALLAAEEEARQASEEADEHTRTAADQRRRAALLRWHAARSRMHTLRDERKRADMEWRKDRRDALLWNAAVPLAEALRCERRAAEVRAQLEEREREHQPLRAELERVARTLCAALAHESQALRARARDLVEEERGARAEAREYRDAASEAERRRGAAEADARQMREQLDRADAQRNQLRQDGVIDADESAHAAETRWQGRVEESQKACARIDEALATLEVRLEEIDASLQAVREERGAAVQAEKGLRAELARAESERAVLHGNGILQEVLQIEDGALDLDVLDEVHAASILEAAALREQEAVVDHQLKRASDERDAVHIKEHGLLPAAPEVRALTAFLAERLDAAWSGWHWLAENTASGDTAYEAVRRAPGAARGIVVRDRDLDKAQALIEAAIDAQELPAEVPRRPVILATPRVFETRPADDRPDQDGRADIRVIGPRERGFFDRRVARTRLGALQTRLDASQEKIRAARERQRQASDCRASLMAFRERYPRGYFAEKAAELDAAQARVEDLEARAHALEGERDIARQRRESLRSERREHEREGKRAAHLADRARKYREHFEDHLHEWRTRLQESERALVAAARDIEESRQLAREADARADEASQASRERGEDARTLEDERQALRYVGSEQPAPRPGALDQLRSRYRDRRDVYEERIDAKGLLAVAEDNERNSQYHRNKMRPLLADGMTEDEVAEALANLPENVAVETVRMNTEAKEKGSMGRLGNIAQKQEQNEKVLRQAEDACRAVDLPPLPASDEPTDDGHAWLATERLPSEPLIAEQEATECDRAADEAGQRADESRARAETANKRAERARLAESHLSSDAQQLESVRESYGDLLSRGTEPTAEDAGDAEDAEDAEDADDARAMDAGPLTLEDSAIGRELRQLGQSLKHSRERWKTLDDERGGHASQVRTWAEEERFDSLKSGLPRRFRQHDDDAMENDSTHFIEQLELRLEQLRAQIEDADHQRRVLIDEVLSVARDGLDLLKQADARSTLPDHLPGLGGARFLHIITRTPDDPDEERGRIGQLVDELAHDTENISGIALMQRAVRRLIRPVRVRILHPDPALGRRFVDIAEMARFSGGEQLTGAILLYCTLARLRAHRRGLTRRPASVLILDNPIGRASRVHFLELQRDVARAMDVQLVYTTAINDYDALSALPNVIRLRNQRVDRNRGHRLVEHISAADADESDKNWPELSAVRLARGEEERPRGES